jgi:hypothetical protein
VVIGDLVSHGGFPSGVLDWHILLLVLLLVVLVLLVLSKGALSSAPLGDLGGVVLVLVDESVVVNDWVGVVVLVLDLLVVVLVTVGSLVRVWNLWSPELGSWKGAWL